VTAHYKLARFNPVLLCWKDGRTAYPTLTAARAAATDPGVYRVSVVQPGKPREDFDPFTIEGNAPAPAPRKPKRGGLRRHPGPWHMHGGARPGDGRCDAIGPL